jgi:porin
MGLNMWHKTVTVGLATVAAILAGGAAGAADLPVKALPPAVPACDAPGGYLLGNWGGLRDSLYCHGVEFQFGYVNELAYNVTGGTRNVFTYADQYVAGMTLDTQRLLGWHGGTFQVSITERTGHNLSDLSGINSLMLMNEVFGRGQTPRLTQFWYDQKFFNDMVAWKIGRVGVGEDFASFNCDFQNLTFCGSDPGNIAGNYIFNWPISEWGTRVKITLPSFGYFEIGAYDQNPAYLGVHDELAPVWFPGSTGVLIPAELAWLPTFANGTSTAGDVVLDINGNPIAVTGLPAAQLRGQRYGAYVNFQQQLTRTSSDNPKGGLSAFLNAVWANDKTATTDWQIAGGLTYTGPLSWRPNDDIAFAVGSTHVGNHTANAEALQNALGFGPVAVQRSEVAMELYYTIRPVPGLLFRPNVQYIITPGGTSQHGNAFVLGLKTIANC